MAKLEFETKNFLTNPLDFVAPPFPDGGVPDPKNLIPFRKVNSLFKSKGMLTNEDAIRMPIKFTSVPLTQGESAKEYVLPNEPLVSISARKVIVESELYGKAKRKGSVKEIMATESYDIHIVGIIYNLDADDYPDADVKRLIEFFDLGASFKVNNRLLESANITLATCKDIKLPRNQGDCARWQWYSINLVSDMDFELELL